MFFNHSWDHAPGLNLKKNRDGYKGGGPMGIEIVKKKKKIV